MRTLTCKQCNGTMKKRTVVSGRVMGCLIACVLLMLAVGSLFIPVAGFVLAPLFLLAALVSGAKRRKVWRCRQCGAIIDRA